MPQISERLAVIASLAKKGGSVCDVGTDHGYLPAFLCLSGEYSRITATDINEKPLLTAKKNLEKSGIKNVNLILCDGLSGVERPQADTVIIAGMGGEVISGIISRTPFLKDKTVNIILQPMTSADKLRIYLYENGFEILKEIPVLENKKIYSVMQVRFSGEKIKADEVFAVIGKIDVKDSLGRLYIEKHHRIYSECVSSLKNVSGKEKEYLKCAEISNALKNILEE